LLGTHIVDEPDSITVYDGSANQLKQTTFGYDQTAVVASGAQTGLVSPPGARGNTTSVTEWLSSGSSPLTTYTYYDTGQVASKTDPCGNASCADMTGSNHTTSYYYTDSFTTGTAPGQTNAYLTKVIDPLGHISTFTYGYSDGALTSAKDPNGQATGKVTAYKYGTEPSGCSYPDYLDRLTEVDYPDGGVTTYCYNDAGLAMTATKLVDSPSSTNIVTTSLFDGMGHVVQTELVSDPDGPTYTATAYDGSGRVYTKSNPYRTTSDSTYGITTYTYDALGRTTNVAEPDGSSVQTVYDQTCSASANGVGTIVTDETGNNRESCSDSLGRLIEVDEPGAGATMSAAGSGSVTIGGSEQTRSGAPGSGFATLFSSGSQCVYVTYPGNYYYSPSGTVSITVSGVKAGTGTATWSGSCNQQNGALTISLSTIAANLASSLNGSGAGVTATSSGATIQIVANANGPGTDYPVSSSYTLGSGEPGGSPYLFATVPATLTGGTTAAVSDSGTVSITVGGFTANATFGSGTTAQQIASSLASTLNAGSPVEASVNGTVIALTATDQGSDTNYTLSTSDIWNSADFTSPSFTATPSGATLTGGVSGTLGNTPLVTLYSYDALNNLTCAVQKGTDTTAFSSCASAPATWRPRSFVYDSLSRLTSATNPESGTATYAYDPNSNLATRVVPKANQTLTAVTTHTYNYDVLNRLVKESHADPAEGNELYGYDGTALTGCPGPSAPSINSPTNQIGRRSAMCDSQSSSSWSYDPMGRTLFEATANKGTSAMTYTVGYTYFKDGSLNTLAYPSGDLVTYKVGGAGRTTQVTDSANITFVAPPSGAMYAPHGALAGMINGSIVTSNSYNNRLQPFMLSAGVTGQSAIFSLCYDFHLHVAISNSTCGSLPAYTTGNNGNVFQVTNKVSPNFSAVYAYDPLNRLKQANTVNTSSANCWGETYTIDAWGNLTGIATAPGMAGNCVQESLSATATTQNQLSGIGMQYDAAGNVTKDNLGNTPTYDQENRIATVAGYTYNYDASGARMEKTTGSAGTMYWQGPSGALAETNLAGTINEEYIFFNGARIARVDRPSGTVNYYLSDQLASTSVIASPAGVVQEQYFYYPYGGMQSSTGSDPNHYKFTGKERDTESGLDEFGARYYGSSFGRFMTPDWATTPIDVPYADFGNPQSLNLYSYVKNNPTTFGDPDGHCCWEEVKASTIFLGQEVVGLGKGVINAVPSAYNVGAELLNEQGAASGQPYMKLEMAPTIPLNNTGEVVGAAVGSLGLVLLGGVEGGGLRGATAESGEAATGVVPKEGIYEGPDATAPGKTYVGQSGDIPSRLGQHEASGKFPAGTDVKTTEVTGGKTAREVAEHNRIQQLGGVRSQPGSQTSNIRNPIGKNRQHLLKKDQ
jgi:RHS repeat-associated protein